MSLQRILLMTSNICYFIFGNSDCKFKPFTAHDCTMPDHLALFTSNHMPWTFEAVNRPKLETSRNQIILIFLLYPNKRNHMRNKYFGRTKTHPSQLFYSKQKDAVTEEYITLYSKQLVGSREQSREGQLGQSPDSPEYSAQYVSLTMPNQICSLWQKWVGNKKHGAHEGKYKIQGSK